MESSSDEDYIPDFEDEDSDDLSEEFEDEEEEFSEDEALEMEGGWTLIPDLFSDKREDPLPDYLGAPCGISETHKDRVASPGSAFKQFLDREVIEKLCEWTNKRAEMFFAQHPEKRGRVNSLKWKEVLENDMYTLLALLITMGLVKLPRMSQYWRHDWVISGPPVFCKEVMSRDRFFSILKFLRFSPPEEVKKEEPQTRIEPFLSLLRKKSATVISPGKHVAVDEALVLWKGRLGFRQYIKTKRARFGMKVFVLCPSEPSWQGYSWTFELYYGKDSYQFEDPRARSLSKSEKIVVYLMRQLLDEGRHVVTDNWYTSMRLATYLEERNTMITGVVRSGRGPPKDISKLPLEKHQCIFARKKNTLIVRWEDKKDITVLTTKYKADMVEKVKEYFGNQVVFMNKPLHIEKYNQKMGSVDKADQFLEPYDLDRKSLAWFKKIGTHFIFRSALNAYLVWKNASNSKTSYMDFLECLVKELLREHNTGTNKFSKDQEQKPLTPTTHQFVKWEKIGKRKKCRVCYPKRRDTAYFCPACPGEPGLCCMTHYNQYHGKKNEPSSHTRKEGAENRTADSESLSDEPTPSTSDGRRGRTTKRRRDGRGDTGAKKAKP